MKDNANPIRFEMLENPKRWSIILLAVITGFFIFAFIWASTASLDEVTTGEGQVVPSSKTQVVGNLEGGILEKILVKEGDTVKKGQVIIRVDDTNLSSSFRENSTRYYGMMAMTSRLKAAIENKPLTFPKELHEERPDLVASETQLFNAKQQEMHAAIDVLKNQMRQRQQEIDELRSRESHLQTSYKLSLEESRILTPLVKDGVASKVELLRLKREVNQFKGDLNATRLNIKKTQSALEEAKQRIKEKEQQIRSENLALYNETISKQLALKETITAAKDRVSRTELRSPVNGVVKQLLVTSVGEIVKPGEDLIEIVPIEDTLLIQARVRPSDIAFLSPGQKSIVKVTAYDFLIYGGMDATLEQISPDTILDEKDERYYQIYVRTKTNFIGEEDDPLFIKPGMIVEADILTGKKTVLQYLMKPLTRARHKAMRER